MTGAVEVAGQVPGVLAAAQAAYTAGLTTVALVGAAGSVALAVLVVVALRRPTERIEPSDSASAVIAHLRDEPSPAGQQD
ncbi:hypothetical protein NKG94_26940 [Micromonospora sp. M12]